jgi:Tol biopolymer transport system component
MQTNRHEKLLFRATARRLRQAFSLATARISHATALISSANRGQGRGGALWRTCDSLRSVTKPADSDGTPNAGARALERLDSWKEIASYLRRGIRTVQRWERAEGLPVHRLPHAKRGTVYADREELAAWWQSRQTAPAAKPAATVGETPVTRRLERVTNTSAATFFPALSSDARLIVYVSDGGENLKMPQVWLQQVGGAAMRLTSDQPECADPVFSPDDTHVIFTARGESTRNLYEIPALGGQPRLLKRAAKSARFSPDGKHLVYISLGAAGSARVAAIDGRNDRALAPGLFDVSCLSWSPDSRYCLALAHADTSFDLDYWIVPIDGGSPIDTGVLRRLRPQGFFPMQMPPAWAGEYLIFSASGSRRQDGIDLWRQRLTPQTFQPSGNPERLIPSGEMAWFPFATAGRLVYVTTRADMNLWSVALDETSGLPHGPPRRLTRGPGVLGHLSLTSDGRTLAYFTAGRGKADLLVRDLETGSEAVAAGLPELAGRGFPAISPNGTRLAYGALAPGPPIRRPLFLVDLQGGSARQVRDDCGGRPRQWIDEDHLLIETFGSRRNRFVVVDEKAGSEHDLLASKDRSLTNPRVSPNAAWIAFDAASPGGSPTVHVARVSQDTMTPESEWIPIEDSASHPFWSRDGHLLYYLALTPNSDIRGIVRARRFNGASGEPEGEPFEVLTLNEMVVPAMVTGACPIVAPHEMILVLGDFRGDIWIMDL